MLTIDELKILNDPISIEQKYNIADITESLVKRIIRSVIESLIYDRLEIKKSDIFEIGEIKTSPELLLKTPPLIYKVPLYPFEEPYSNVIE